MENPKPLMAIWHIKKIGENKYQVRGSDQQQCPLEDTDGNGLLALLTNKGLHIERMLVLLKTLESEKIGFQTVTTI